MRQLQYEEWLSYIIDEIKLLLPKDADYQVQIIHKLKNNGTTMDSVAIRKNNESIAPAIPLRQYYEYQWSISATAQLIVNDYQLFSQESNMELLQQAKDDLSGWASVQDKVFLRLINMGKNIELLRSTPYEVFGDMALVARIKMFQNQDGMGTVLIDNRLLAEMGISKDTLFQQAKENTPKLFPVKIENMAEKLLKSMYGSNPPEEMMDMLEETNEMQMYIISNTSGMDGAAAVLYPGVEEQVRELIGGDFLLLPSSVHEMLAISKNDISVKHATEMVHEANASVVEAEEFLSNDVYTLKAGECINLTRQMELENSISTKLENMPDLDEGMDFEM